MKLVNGKPTALEFVDWSRVFGDAESYINDLDTGYGHSGDKERYIYESVMKSIFGDDVFNWINDRV